jgi:hypothetical protein
VSQLSSALGRDKPEAWSQLRELERRDWAVRVLDAWVAVSPIYAKPPCAIPNPADGGWSVFVHSYSECQGDTPDAARLAAAEAVFPTLAADVRATLGERP